MKSKWKRRQANQAQLARAAVTKLEAQKPNGVAQTAFQGLGQRPKNPANSK
jgi:hypothetical protein